MKLLNTRNQVMKIKRFIPKSQLSEKKTRDKLSRKSKKSVKTKNDTKFCKNCLIKQEPNYCKVLYESITILYQNLNEYFELRLFGNATKQYINDEWAIVRHSENSLKADRVLKQCPKLRKLLNDYFAYRDNKIEANKLFSK